MVQALNFSASRFDFVSEQGPPTDVYFSLHGGKPIVSNVRHPVNTGNYFSFFSKRTFKGIVTADMQRFPFFLGWNL